jgi:8-oxo-dGTP diphosphatase
MSLTDWMYRVIYRYGYRAARLVWWFTKPHHSGAVVMLWHEGRVLLVRASYGEAWTAPGGGIGTREAPVQAAVREISEELGLEVSPKEMRHVLVVEHFWENRHDKVHIFEVQLSEMPKVEIDNRELIEARFVTPVEAQSFNLPPHLQDYFRMKAAT